jgi:hypothetical protein
MATQSRASITRLAELLPHNGRPPRLSAIQDERENQVAHFCVTLIHVQAICAEAGFFSIFWIIGRPTGALKPLSSAVYADSGGIRTATPIRIGSQDAPASIKRFSEVVEQLHTYRIR